MTNNADRETNLLAPENLPLDLDELGMVTEAEFILPGVYEAILENRETGISEEAFLVFRNAPDISSMAKEYGQAVPDHPQLLAYHEDRIGNTRYIIFYEIYRYKIAHRLPLPEADAIRSIAAIGAETYPEYFGCYPIPFLTPWGCTTRNKIIANGLYWLETEQAQRGLAVAYPKFDDLSDGTRGLADPFDDGSARTNGGVPGYLFFRETNSSVPLFELISALPKEQMCCTINWAALMNAVYQFFPEYAAQHNLAELAGRNDGIGQFFRSLGINVDLKSDPGRLIAMSAQAGTTFIHF